MLTKPLFAGLVFDENDQLATTAYVGEEPCYVLEDAGFKRHIPSRQVDLQVLEMMRSQIKGNEDQLSEQAARMLGTDDIFSRAMLENQLRNIQQQFESLLQAGIPEEGRAYLGMSGFKVVIDFHGQVVRLDQPSAPEERGEGE